MFCAATVPNESNTPAIIMPRSTGQNIGARPTTAKPAAIASAAVDHGRLLELAHHQTTREQGANDPAAVPEHGDQAVAEGADVELVGKRDLGHDHGADSDHDKRPGDA